MCACRYDLLPYCYMSFYVADRKFFNADVAAGLYHTSAYYVAQMLAGVASAKSMGTVGLLCSEVMEVQCLQQAVQVCLLSPTHLIMCARHACFPCLTLIQSKYWQRPCGRPGSLFVVLNTLVASLAAYGLAGLRPDPWAVAHFSVVLVLQSLVAIQVMILSIFTTPNQARPRTAPRKRLGMWSNTATASGPTKCLLSVKA